MNTFLLYTKGSRHQNQLESFARELERRGVRYELVEADSPHGITLMLDYDLKQRPAAVLTGPDGTMIERWEGQMPSASDVSYLFHR